MSLYKVILVDDEAEILEGMSQKIAWEEIGFELVGLAENGLVALDLVMDLEPDVIITDIQMPFMTGLELIEEAKKIVPRAKIVVFSGYDIFEYAQKAIALHASSYLLKPFSSLQFQELLLKLKQEMDNEWQAKRDLQQLETRYAEALPLLRNNFLFSCLSGHVSSETATIEGQRFKLGSNETLYTVVLIKFSQRRDENHLFDNKEELIPLALQGIVDQHFTNLELIHRFNLGDDLVLLLAMDERAIKTDLMPKLDEVCREGREIVGGKFLAGIGRAYVGLHQLRDSYQEALQAFDYSFLLDQEADFTTYYGDVVIQSQKKYLEFEEGAQRLLQNSLKFGTEQELTAIFDAILTTADLQTFAPYEYQIYMLEIITTMMKLVNSYKLANWEVLYEELSAMYRELPSYALDEAKGKLKQLGSRISDSIQTEASDSTRSLIKRAKHYVTEHYADETLTVEDVSGMLFLSPTYFSTIFKKEAGISFISYLTETRLEIAVELLLTTDKKTYEISTEVGYAESNYFSYVFKRKYGVPPTKYRTLKGGEPM